jgi:tRNA uridine 5-carboxymethylaminomethyl modification enzyme
LLRQDNADSRLTHLGYNIGLADEGRVRQLEQKSSSVNSVIHSLKTEGITPGKANKVLIERQSAAINQQVKLSSLIMRPQLSLSDVLSMDDALKDSIESFVNGNIEVLEQAEILLKYQGYVDRKQELVNKTKRLEDVILPKDIDYMSIKSLSIESKEKLTNLKPRSIGQASRISGVSPSDISVLLIHIGR